MKDQQLRFHLRNGLPLTRHPFDGIAQALKMDRAEILLQISRLKSAGKLGNLRGVFEGIVIQYQDYLCAIQVDECHCEAALNFLEKHPAVEWIGVAPGESWNLWFGLMLPQGHVCDVYERQIVYGTHAKDSFVMATAKKFFDPIWMPRMLDAEEVARLLTAENIRIMQLIQNDFPVDDDPFQKIAGKAGLPVEELLRKLNTWKKQGILKSIRPVPVQCLNGLPFSLIFWDVPEETAGYWAPKLAADDEIHHCAWRNAPDFFHFRLQASYRSQPRSDAFLKMNSWPNKIFNMTHVRRRPPVKLFDEALEGWKSAACSGQLHGQAEKETVSIG